MSVGPTRGPMQRPGIERDLSELFQRVEDLERLRSGGDWRLVERQSGNGVGFDFDNIPQDARNLVVIAAFKAGNGPYPLSFNGDGGAHYAAISDLIEDAGAGPTQTLDSSAGDMFIDLLLSQGSAAYGGGLVLTVPGYRFVYNTGERQRTCVIHTWCDGNVTVGTDFYRKAEIAGFWNDHPGAAASAITRISLLGNGVNGEAELYKVL